MQADILNYPSIEKKQYKESKVLHEPSCVMMLSGGVDSVAVLKQLLEETDDKVYAHHIHIKNNEGMENFKRYKAEALALRKIIPYMKKTFRDFHYSESTIDVRQISNLRIVDFDQDDSECMKVIKKTYTTYDALNYHMIAGMLANITNSSFIYTGDMHPPLHRGKEYIKAFDHLDLIFYGSVWPHKAEIKRPFFDEYCKIKNIEYLGKELMDMVWYCRHPLEENGKILSCNTNLGIYKQEKDPETSRIYKCRSCEDVNDAILEIEETQKGLQYAYSKTS